MERRLSAIFAADMVGYSRLMEADEVGTLERQKAHRRELINPVFEESHGRIVKEMGDGILVEFPSVVDAVQCAVKIQRAMPDREAGIAEDRRIAYRIGINLGDIIVEDDDIYGDGVNVAARLEQLADPGGICISGTTFDHLKSQVEVGYEALGEIKVKNLKQPVRAYKVLIDSSHASSRPGGRRPPRPGKIFRALGALVIVLIAATGAAGFWWAQKPDFQPADPNQYSFKIPEKPSIAALPFANMTGDPTFDRLGESLVDNILVELSASKDLAVAPKYANGSVGGESVTIQNVAEQNGVRYVLSGSMQRSGDRLRIIAQLVDALAGRQVWAERYDYDGRDVLTIQDDLTLKILSELQANLTIGSKARLWQKNWGQIEYYRRLVAGYLAVQRGNADGLSDVEDNWSQLYELRPFEPGSIRFMAWIHIMKGLYGLFGIIAYDPANWEIAHRYALKATEFEAGEPPAEHFRLLSFIDYWQGRRQAALANAEKSLELDPGNANIVVDAGSIKLFSGQVEEGFELIKSGIAMEPTFPYYAALNLANAYAMLGRYDEARNIGDELLTVDDAEFLKRHTFGILITAATAQGDVSAARQYARRLVDLYPDITVDHFAKIRQFEADRRFVGTFLDALRHAGLPESN